MHIMKSLLYIYNPKSGHEMLESKVSQTIDYLTKRDYLVTAYPTQGGYDLSALLSAARNADHIIYAGGDGMLNAAVNFQLSNGISLPIGYIPAGTTNDFARSMGLGGEYIVSLHTALNGQGQELDAGQINQRYFIYVAAFGVFSDISYTTPQESKNMLGYAAYLLEGAKKLSDLTAHTLTIRYADHSWIDLEGETQFRTIEGDFVFGMITNSYSVAGFKNLSASDISLTDGLFEVVLVRYPQNLTELSEVVHALLSGRDDACRLLRFKTSELHISSREKLSWCLDGEYGGSYTESDIRNLNKAVRIRMKG